MMSTDDKAGTHARTIISYRREAVPQALNLRSPDGIAHAFFAWESDPPAVDGGLPLAVARVFSAMLCARFNLTLIGDAAAGENASSQWSRVGLYSTQKQMRLWKRTIPLIWTRNAGIAQLAFDQGWTTEGQFILLSTGLSPVQCDAHDLVGDPERVLALVRTGDEVTGALLPGVDGAVAGLYLHDDGMLVDLLEHDLAEACQREGVILAVVRGRKSMLTS